MFTGSLNVSDNDYHQWPRNWNDSNTGHGESGPGDVKNNVESFLEDVYSREQYHDELGVPCRRVDPATQERLLPCQWVSTKAASSGNHGDNPNTEYIALSRTLSVEHPGDETVCKMVEKSRVGVQFKIVPKADVARLEKDGWEV